MKRHEPGKRDASLLALELNRWLLNVKFKDYQQTNNPEDPDQKKVFVGREKNAVCLKYQNMDAIMTFEPAGTYQDLNFSVQISASFARVDESFLARFRKNHQDYLDRDGEEPFTRIFYDPVLSFGNIKIWDRVYAGPKASTEIVSVPEGSRGRLSDSLFVCAHNGIVIPLYNSSFPEIK